MTSPDRGATSPFDSCTWHQSASCPGTESSVGTLGVHDPLLELEPQAASASTAPAITPRTNIDIEATSPIEAGPREDIPRAVSEL
jgi:hypothetical protein